MEAEDAELARLKRIYELTAGVLKCSVLGRDKARLNERRVTCRVEAPADDPQGRSVILLSPECKASVPSLLEAARAMHAKLAAVVGEAAIAEAEARLALREPSSTNHRKKQSVLCIPATRGVSKASQPPLALMLTGFSSSTLRTARKSASE